MAWPEVLLEMGPRVESVLSGRKAAVSFASVRKVLRLSSAVAGEIGRRVCRIEGGRAVVMMGGGGDFGGWCRSSSGI